MSRYSSDKKSRASKKAKAVIDDLRKDLERRNIVKPEPSPRYTGKLPDGMKVLRSSWVTRWCETEEENIPKDGKRIWWLS